MIVPLSGVLGFFFYTFSPATPSFLYSPFVGQRDGAMARLWPRFSNAFKNTRKIKKLRIRP